MLLASNGQLLEPHVNEVVSTLNNLLSYEELEVQYNAVGAIFNLTAMRGKPKECRMADMFRFLFPFKKRNPKHTCL